MTDARCVWHVPRSPDFHSRLWGDYGVVYDAASGNTHLLDALQLELLEQLRQTPRSLQALQADLAELVETEPGAPESATLDAWQERLQSLHRLGLIHPLEPRP